MHLDSSRRASKTPHLRPLPFNGGEVRERIRFADAANLPPFRFREWKAQRQFLFVNASSATRA